MGDAQLSQDLIRYHEIAEELNRIHESTTSAFMGEAYAKLMAGEYSTFSRGFPKLKDYLAVTQDPACKRLAKLIPTAERRLKKKHPRSSWPLV